VFRFVFLPRSDKSIFTTANLRYLRFKNPNLFDFTQNNIFCKSLKTNKIKLKPKAMIYVFVVFDEFAILYSKSIIYNCHKIRLLGIYSLSNKLSLAIRFSKLWFAAAFANNFAAG
jgi:hypothetical protein